MANLTLESAVSIKDMVFWNILILKMELNSFVKDEWSTDPGKSRGETAVRLLAKIEKDRANFITMIGIAFDDVTLTQSILNSSDWKTLDELIASFQTGLVVGAAETAMEEMVRALSLPLTHPRMVAYVDPMKVIR